MIGKPDPVVTSDRHLQLRDARATHPDLYRTERRDFGVLGIVYRFDTKGLSQYGNRVRLKPSPCSDD